MKSLALHKYHSYLIQYSLKNLFQKRSNPPVDRVWTRFRADSISVGKKSEAVNFERNADLLQLATWLRISPQPFAGIEAASNFYLWTWFGKPLTKI